MPCILRIYFIIYIVNVGLLGSMVRLHYYITALYIIIASFYCFFYTFIQLFPQ